MAGQPKSARIVFADGRAFVEVNGERRLPFFYGLTHSFAGRASWEEPKQEILRKMADAGVRLYQVDVYFEDIWHADQPELDIAFVQKQLGGVLRACPDAGIVLRIHVNAPFWWNLRHKDECTRYADGRADWAPKGDEWSIESGDIERALRASLASAVWRQEAGARLKELCTRLAATREGDALIGMHVACGIYGEWHYWGSFSHEPDTGPVMTAAFRRRLRAAYGTDAALQQAWASDAVTLASAAVPDLAARQTTTFGAFHDPARQRPWLDYLACQMEEVADAIEYFCAIVKSTWPRPTLTGIFYGYFHMTFCRTGIMGHACMERIENSPVIDYLSAPQSYWGGTRKLGGSGNSRGVIESAAVHQKLWLDELDNGGESKGVDDPDYLPVLRRSALVPLLRGQGFWYYDFGIGQGAPGWFGGPRSMQQIRAEKDVFDAASARPRRSAADVLFVWDYTSMSYLKNAWTPVTYMMLDQAMEDALRSGAAIDEVYTFDLATLDLAPYRVVVFGNAFCMTPEQRALIAERVACADRTLIYSYLPGVTDGRQMGLDMVQAVAGVGVRRVEAAPGKPRIVWSSPAHTFELEAWPDPAVVLDAPDGEVLATVQASPGAAPAAVAVRQQRNGYTCVYSTMPIAGSAVYLALFRTAGCHIYQDGDEALWASSQFVLLHTARGGPRTLRLRNGQTVTLQLAGAATVLVDAATGAVVLG